MGSGQGKQPHNDEMEAIVPHVSSKDAKKQPTKKTGPIATEQKRNVPEKPVVPHTNVKDNTPKEKQSQSSTPSAFTGSDTDIPTLSGSSKSDNKPAPDKTHSLKVESAASPKSSRNDVKPSSQQQTSQSASAQNTGGDKSAPVAKSTEYGAMEKQMFRMLMKLCLQLAKEQRERVGKFRKDERHCGMELYEVMGLDEDEFIAPPTELQLALSQYRFPPPNMHLLRDTLIDEATMVLMLGPTEAQKRKDQGFVVGEANKTFRANDTALSRRVAVSSEGTTNILSLTTHKVIEKTPEQRDRLTTFISTNVLFKNLDARDKRIILDSFAIEQYRANDRIFEQGDEGDKFFLIDSGRCEIVICDADGTPRPSIFIGEGDTFGELGVMYGTPRAASVYAATAASLWWIDRDTYRSTLLQQTLRKRERYIQFIETVPILEGLDGYEKTRLADVLEVVEGGPGWVVCHEGDLGDTFYIVEEGTLVVTKKLSGDTVLNTIREGSYFGELALLFDQPRNATVTASSNVRLVALNRKSFVAYLGPLESILRRNAQRYEKIMARTNE